MHAHSQLRATSESDAITSPTKSVKFLLFLAGRLLAEDGGERGQSKRSLNMELKITLEGHPTTTMSIEHKVNTVLCYGYLDSSVRVRSFFNRS